MAWELNIRNRDMYKRIAKHLSHARTSRTSRAMLDEDKIWGIRKSPMRHMKNVHSSGDVRDINAVGKRGKPVETFPRRKERRKTCILIQVVHKCHTISLPVVLKRTEQANLAVPKSPIFRADFYERICCSPPCWVASDKDSSVWGLQFSAKVNGNDASIGWGIRPHKANLSVRQKGTQPIREPKRSQTRMRQILQLRKHCIHVSQQRWNWLRSVPECAETHAAFLPPR